MFRFALNLIVATCLLLSTPAGADPVTLKLSFFTSDRSLIYQTMIKPFVDAVNTQAKGLVQIKVYFSGTISAVQSEQPRLVSDDTADLALIAPGRTPDRFPDTGVLELPGLFKNAAEASRIYARLAANGTLSGYSDYYVVGAFVSAGESISSRKPIASLADLKGLKIRVNNNMEAEVLERLGAVPVLLAINNTTGAVSSGTIDGATLPPSMLFQFGIGRVTSHHYMIHLGGVPVALVMNRKKFESLPAQAQAIIRKNSGEAFSVAASKKLVEDDDKVLQQLEADPRRQVVFPSAADTKTIAAAFAAVIHEFSGSSDRNRDLLKTVRQEIAQTQNME